MFISVMPESFMNINKLAFVVCLRHTVTNQIHIHVVFSMYLFLVCDLPFSVPRKNKNYSECSQ